MERKYRRLIGVGGIGAGLFFALEGNENLGRNESRAATLLDARDYCKLHIVTHYLATLLDGALHIVPLGKVGSDNTGLRLLEEMKTAGIDVSHIQISTTSPTLLSVCYQYPDGSGGNITANNSASTNLALQDVDSIVGLFEEHAGRCVALALPEVPLSLRDHLLTRATNFGALRVAAFTSGEIADARRIGIFERVDLLFLNQDEAEALTETVFDPFEPAAFLEKCARTVRDIQPEIRIVVTAGKQGAYGLEADEWVHSPACEVKVASTAGAGDALIAGTLTGLISGVPLVEQCDDDSIHSALDFGVLLGSYSTTSPHTIHPNAELQDVLTFANAAGKDVGFSLLQTALVSE
jgi:sugar/nucleoside kinase (ribokinase family)